MKKCGGDYVYLGFLNGIRRILSENQAAIPDEKINSIVNVDGVPLYKSSGAQFWPILCRFHKLPSFIVAIYYGNKKPSNVEDFVLDFFTEYRNLRNDGVEFGGVKLSIEIFSVICDAPARQFLKSIKGHNGYWSCEQCEIQGLHESSRIVFHTIDCTPRVNDIFIYFIFIFNNYGYAEKHQVQRSCLIDYGINCINVFPLDYMHLVCLGVVKRLILFWKEGPRGPHRLSAAQLSQTSNKLEEMTGLFPSEFVRQPRGFDEAKRWKATELRQFLLYSGCVALKDVLTHEYYKQFLMLSLTMRILLDENENIRSHYLTYTRDLLRCFVAKCQELYGNTFTVYNVHGLLQLWEDSHFFKKPLDGISSFSLEHYLQVLKKFVRKSQNPLSQVVRRVAELEEHALSGSYHKVVRIKYSVNKKDA